MHTGSDLLTLFIDGLEPSIQTFIARQLEAHCRCTYLEIVQYARAEGDAVRSRSHSAKSSTQ